MGTSFVLDGGQETVWLSQGDLCNRKGCESDDELGEHFGSCVCV